jgi:hypothetical protein
VPALAQRTTGDIVGTVKDETGAVLPGASVSVSGENIAGAKSDVTSGNGVYRIGSLPPGTYTLTCSLAGFKTLALRGVRVSVGSAIEENIALLRGPLSERVEVIARAAMVDTTSTEVATILESNWIEAAPTRRFGYFDLVAQAPGSVKGGDGPPGFESHTMVFGGSHDENSFQLDGVNVTDNYLNEGFAEPSPDVIEQVEVLSLGAPAEYGNMMGGVYNIVTRQGTNRLHGDVSYFYQSDGLTGDNTADVKRPNGEFFDVCSDDETKRCPWTRGDYWEVSAQLGGPVVKDKLWFFASYGHRIDDHTNRGVNAQDPFSAVRFDKDHYFLKLNWQIGPGHRLVGTFSHNESAQDTGVIFTEAPSTAWTRTQKVPAPGLAYTGALSSRTTLDVRYSGFYGNVTGRPTDPAAPLSQAHVIDLDTGLVTGGPFYWYDFDSRRTSVTARLSHHADDFLGGDHDFRFGVQWSDAGVTGIYGENDLVYTYTDGGVRRTRGFEHQPFAYGGTARNLGVFADDSFRMNDRLTVSLGLRYDHSKAFSPESAGLDRDGNATAEVFPHIDHYTWSNVSPRLGLNWKLTADGKTVLKLHAGRYRPQISTGEFANVIGPSITPRYMGNAYNFATATFEDLSLLSSNENLGVDPEYGAPRTDQVLVAVERQLLQDVALRISYVRKWGRDFAGWEETAGTYAPIRVVDNVGQDPTGASIDAFMLTSNPAERQFQITNREELFTDVHALSATVSKRMTRWYANASATWLRGEGLVAGSALSSNIDQRSGLQFNTFGRNPNSYVNAAGRLNGDVGWAFKLQLVYELPAGFVFSTSVDHRDGAHRLRTRMLPPSVTGIPSTLTLSPRGSFGRLPRFTIVDARLQKDFALGGRARLSVFVDALNLGNEDANQQVQSTNATSPIYQYPVGFAIPRRLMLGAKASF